MALKIIFSFFDLSKLKFRILIASLIIFCFSNVLAQDSTYIKKYPHKGNFKINVGVLTQYLDLYSSKLKGDSALSVFVPNVNATLGFSASWRFLSLGYSFKLPNDYYPASKFGTTTYRNLSLSSYYRRFGFEGFYRTYDGFFQPDKFYKSSTIRSDISFLHTGLNLFYFGNSKKFSFRSAFSQSRKQIKSAGGIVVMSELGYKKFSGDISLLPASTDNVINFGKYKGLKGVSFATFEIRPGYAYDFVFEKGKYYICPMLLGGFGASIYHFNTDSLNQRTAALHFDANFRISAGYDIEHFFMNLNFEMEYNANFLSQSTVLSHTYFNLNFTAGYRFGKKEKVKSEKEKAKKQKS